MDALGGCGGAGGFWGWNGFDQRRKKKSSGDRGKKRNSGSSDSVDVSRDAGGYRFPLKQAVTAGALTFTGDTIAQLSGRWKKRTALKQSSSELDEVCLWRSFGDFRVIDLNFRGFSECCDRLNITWIKFLVWFSEYGCLVSSDSLWLGYVWFEFLLLG